MDKNPITNPTTNILGLKYVTLSKDVKTNTYSTALTLMSSEGNVLFYFLFHSQLRAKAFNNRGHAKYMQVIVKNECPLECQSIDLGLLNENNTLQLKLTIQLWTICQLTTIFHSEIFSGLLY